MRCISLWQPWASLIATGAKKIETRSWKAPEKLIGQRIAIHATKTMPVWVRALCRGFAKLLGIEKYNGSWLYYLEHGVGPFGKVVATCKLVACLPIKTMDKLNETAYADLGDSWYVIDGNEYHFGDYNPGRFAWILDDIRPLKEPLLAKGMQGLWNWDETNYKEENV